MDGWLADIHTQVQVLCCLSDNFDLLVQVKLVGETELGILAWPAISAPVDDAD